MELLDRMRMFTRVLEAGSLSAAAREAGSSQPTVSRQITSLERELGTQLLTRTTVKIRPTEAGEMLYVRAKHLLEEFDAVRTGLGKISNGLHGTLRVHAPASFGEAYLTPVLVRLGQAHPDLSIDLVLNDRWLDLVEERIDVSVRFGTLPDVRLVARRIGASPQVCIATPAYLARAGTPVGLSDLLGHRCVVNGFVSPTNEWRFCGPHGETTVPVRSSFRTNNLRAVREVVLADGGIAVGPEWLYFEDLREGRVVIVLQPLEPVPLDIHAMHVPSTWLPLKVRHFIDELESALRAIPALAPHCATRSSRPTGGMPAKPLPEPAEACATRRTRSKGGSEGG
jgi:DNA-binding transcriptional LysR family regulator